MQQWLISISLILIATLGHGDFLAEETTSIDGRSKRSYDSYSPRSSRCEAIRMTCPRVTDIPACPRPQPPTACLAPPACPALSCNSCPLCPDCKCKKCTDCPDCVCLNAKEITGAIILSQQFRRKRSIEETPNVPASIPRTGTGKNSRSTKGLRQEPKTGFNFKGQFVVKRFHTQAAANADACSGDHMMSGGRIYCIVPDATSRNATITPGKTNAIVMWSPS